VNIALKVANTEGSYSIRLDINMLQKLILVFAFWYLLIPPVTTSHKRPSQVDTSAQLSHWGIWHRFEKAEDCQTALKTLQANLAIQYKRTADPGFFRPEDNFFGGIQPNEIGIVSAKVARSAMCLPSDDTRLAAHH
jgi:hypothetical protein